MKRTAANPRLHPADRRRVGRAGGGNTDNRNGVDETRRVHPRAASAPLTGIWRLTAETCNTADGIGPERTYALCDDWVTLTFRQDGTCHWAGDGLFAEQPCSYTYDAGSGRLCMAVGSSFNAAHCGTVISLRSDRLVVAWDACAVGSRTIRKRATFRRVSGVAATHEADTDRKPGKLSKFKNMLKKLLFTLAAAAALLSAGCSDKDDDRAIEAADLIGKWILVAEYDGDIDEWDYDWAEAGWIETLEFRADGTGTDYEKSPNNTGRSEEFTWSLDGSVLSRYFPQKNDTQIDPIERLSGDELLFIYEYTLDDGNTYVDKALYNRM